MSPRQGPRRAAAALRDVLAESAPRTLLAEVQMAWAGACGAAIAAESQPVAERDGIVTIACRSSTWASELDLMQDALRDRLDGAVGEGRIQGLRFTADAARHDSR
jgi:predicted nucleic acid-binding Zn ribbon protein